jgi:hypothetical protein
MLNAPTRQEVLRLNSGSLGRLHQFRAKTKFRAEKTSGVSARARQTLYNPKPTGSVTAPNTIGTVRVILRAPSEKLRPDVRFSNRPFRVKRFQTIHHYSVDVARGLVLLFGQ